MKTLLCTLNAKYIHVNLAVRLLYSLNRYRKGLDWREFTIRENPADIALKCSGYDVVAFSCYIWNISQTLAVAREIKKHCPAVKILLGGPEVSFGYEEFIALPEVDFIVVGEGEIPFSQFLENYPLVENVPGLVYMQDAGMRCNPNPENFDLENYRNINPYEFDPPGELLNKVSYIETSRGCPYKCEFCLASLDNKVRYLPMESVKSNLLYLMQHGRVIKFLDRTFNIKKGFTIEIFEFILDHHRPGNVFQFEITADIVHPDIVEFILNRVPKGLFRFEIGIQTVNEKANLMVSRRQDFEKTSAVIRQLEPVVEMHLDLIVGLPLDEWEDIRRSIEDVFNLYPPELQLGFLKFLRGTPMRKKYKEHHYVFDEMPPYQIIESKYLSRQELFDISLLEEALEIYWNKKRACLTLKYVSVKYGIFDFLLGLGKYFHANCDFHRHTLYDIYDLLFAFSAESHPEDIVLQQLVAIDYYGNAKIKPATRYLAEISQEEKLFLTAQHQFNHHVFRYVFLPVDFDVNGYISGGTLTMKRHVFVIRYNGRSMPAFMQYPAGRSVSGV